MLKKIRCVFLIVISLFTLSMSPCALAKEGTSEDDIWQESVGDLSIVAGIGLGGAVLGLSTLSFVDEPKDHLKNVLIGGALGVIIGVGVVAWQQATKSSRAYKGALLSPDFGTAERVAWQNSQSEKTFYSNAKQKTSVQYQFSF